MSGPWDAALSVAREMRRVPGLRQAFENTDDARRARRLEKSGLIDTDLYARFLDVESITPTEAARHYVRWGHWAGLTVNALIDDRALRATLPTHGRPPVFEYLWTRSWDRTVSPAWDLARYTSEHPDSLSHEHGPVGHLWERVRRDASVEVPTAMGGQIPFRELRAEQLEAFSEWARWDAMRRSRNLRRHYRGQKTLGDWERADEAPLVSIVLATWNRSGELRRAVESVLAQTWQRWELLIVDDGSWDDTAVIAGVLAARDLRVRFLPEEHHGVAQARNTGIDASTGEFVAFLDSDNAWEPRFLEEMMLGMRSGASVAFSTIEVDNGTHRLFRESPATPENLSLGNVVDLNTLVVRRDALIEVGGFDVSLRRAVDYDLILRLSANHEIIHVPVLGAIYENKLNAGYRISTSEALGWNTLVRLKASIDWDAVRSRPLHPGTAYLLISTRADPWLDQRLDAAAELGSLGDTTVHVAMVDPSPSEWLAACRLAGSYAHVRLHMFASGEPYAYVVNTVVATVERERLVVVEPSVRWQGEDLQRIAAELDEGAARVVAPVLLASDGTMRGIGAFFPKPASPPCDILEGHPIEDALALGAGIDVPALTGRTFGVRTRDLVTIGGLNPLMYNEFDLPALSVTLATTIPDIRFTALPGIQMRHLAGPFDFEARDPLGSRAAVRELTKDVVVAAVDGLLAPLEMSVAHFEVRDEPVVVRGTEEASDAAPVIPTLRAVLQRSKTSLRITDRGSRPLRWAIRVASPRWPVGGTWGDTHFAHSLADALRRLGQQVIIDHHETGARRTAYLDDVTLVVRGLDDVRPVTGGASMLWVISHPELVSMSEIGEYDAVFAASSSWADQQNSRWNASITPLLQCTDASMFSPQPGPEDQGILFVGKSRGVARPVVVYPYRAGVPLRVIGSEWEGILPPEAVEAPYVPNAELGSLYGSATVVLNDHWAEMRRDGFISNRIFDVVAAGGRVISDRVEGIEEIFGPAVVMYDSPQHLVDLLRGDVTALFPSRSALAEISERVRAEHTFDARAQVLLDRATRLLAPGRSIREGNA